MSRGHELFYLYIFRCSVLEAGEQSIPLRLQKDLQLYLKCAINMVLIDGSEYSYGFPEKVGGHKFILSEVKDNVYLSA